MDNGNNDKKINAGYVSPQSGSYSMPAGAEYKAPAADDRARAANAPVPPADNKAPDGTYQPQAGNYQAQNGNYQNPTGNYQTPNSNYQTPAGGYNTGYSQYAPDYRYMSEMPYAYNRKEMSSGKKVAWNLYLLLEGLAGIAGAIVMMVFGVTSMLPMPFLLSIALGWFGISDLVRLAKKDYPESFFKTLFFTIGFLTVAMIAFTRPVNFKSSSESRYFMQARYVEMLTDSEDFFPESIPEDIENYKLQIKKKAIGKSTWASVCYQLDDFASSSDRKEIEDMLYSRSFSLLDNDRPIKLSDTRTLERKGIYLKYNEDFWFGYEDRAYVLVKQATGNKDRPRTKAIIVYPEKGMIEYTVLDY